MTGMLERMGCTVTIAKNGREAVTTFVEGRFDVVLMDVQMPVMDGIAATQIIRQHEVSLGTHTPIVAVTAGMDRQTCIDAGMDDHLRKPVRSEILVSALRNAASLNSNA
jgi:CheY-like chemotaxis protein